jgi:hypothetical protein
MSLSSSNDDFNGQINVVFFKDTFINAKVLKGTVQRDLRGVKSGNNQ